jgi:hypothetical protein
MTLRFWAVSLWMSGILIPTLGAVEAQDAATYRQGLRDFHAGSYTAARDAFQKIAPRNSADKTLQRLLAQARVKADMEARQAETLKSAAAQARLLLAVRQAVIQELNTSAPSVVVSAAGTGTRFSFPGEFLFPKTGLDLTGPGDAALSLAKDFIQTHRTVYVRVVCEQDPKAEEDAKRRNVRRTIALGARLFRQAGLAPTQIRLTVRPGKKNKFHVLSDTLPAVPDAAEREVEGVLMTAWPTTLNLDRDDVAKMEISILDPSGVRSWAVKIVRLSDGMAVYSFAGTSDVWASFAWDGRDFRNRPVSPGLYRAYLTARVFSGAERTDSLGLVVDKKQAAPVSRPRPPDLPLPVNTPGPVNRRWAHVVGFPFNKGEVVGGALVELRQLAGNLKAFPEERVIVEGFAEPQEENPRKLAKQRAQSIVDLLISLHGISSERLSAVGREPEGAGEGSRKAVAFFLDKEGK